jgi:peptidoglycan/LPS O-acetylase OafA/YrhL
MLLDLTRVALSLMVAAGHWTQSFFQDTWPDLTPYGVMAVGGFFILSGFTIRMLYPSGEHFSFNSYVVERWSRILSVTIPALLLTAILDTISWRVNPTYYIGNWRALLDHPLRQLLVNLLGVSEVWGHDITPLSNSPFWSIGYELGFYLVYGLWLSGRKVLAAGSLLLLGPQIALLLPLWLLGVVAYDVCCASRPARQPRGAAVIASTLAVGGFAVAGIVALFGQRVRTAYLTSGLQLHRVSLHVVLGALIFFPLFALAVRLASRSTLRPSAKSKALVRWLGNLTFPIYLFHFPMFVFLAALHLYDRHSTLQRVLAFAIVLALIALAAPATDYFKVRLRSALSWVLEGTAPSVLPQTQPSSVSTRPPGAFQLDEPLTPLSSNSKLAGIRSQVNQV